MKNNSRTFRVTIEVLAIGGLFLHALLVFGLWNLLPPTIPVHFGIDGQADAWGHKNSMLLLFGLSLLIYLGLSVLERYPHKFNYPWQITENNAAQQYDLAKNLVKTLKAEIVWLFAIITAVTVGISFGLIAGLGSFFLIFVIAVTGLTVIIYMLRASRSAH